MQGPGISWASLLIKHSIQVFYVWPMLKYLQTRRGTRPSRKSILVGIADAAEIGTLFFSLL